MVSVNSELAMAEESAKLKRRHVEDISNNENMLVFKQDQLNNLKTIHAEMVQALNT